MEGEGKSNKCLGWLIILITAFLFSFSFPRYHFSEFAYFFAVPFLMWGFRSNNRKILWWFAFFAGWLGWLLIVMWLRHVWIGLPVVGAAYAGLYVGLWLYISSIVLKKVIGLGKGLEILSFLGLSGVWVILEWMRGWLFSGYPWLPLAASQWKLPVVLQILPWTGAYGLSFILIFFNLAIASFFIQLSQRVAKDKLGRIKTGVRPLALYLGIAMLGMLIVLFLKYLPKKENQEFLFNAGVVQPNITPRLSWDRDFFIENITILKDETLNLRSLNPDVVLWSETAVPSPISKDSDISEWLQDIVDDMNTPFLVGGIVKENDMWYNGIFEVRPQTGIANEFYAKRKRVPFGEYIPLRGWIPFVKKVVPVSFDLAEGARDEPILVEIAKKTWRVSGLVCYEDIFASLARRSLLKGTDFFLVITDDAWYLDEGGAYQHAAHSVLRAVEFRRPVIRCGNNGWSGWIDEYGLSRYVALSHDGTVYYRGGAVFPVYRDRSMVDHMTFYAKHGDWFVLLSAFLVLLMGLVLRKTYEVQPSAKNI